MRLDEVDRLLDPTPLPIETGYERLADGVLHVAVRTDMHRCTGEMFEWWFRFRPNTQQYVWWHPVDHFFSDWIDAQPDTHVGSTHVVEEKFGEIPPAKLSIQFRDPTELFDAAAYREARASKRVTAAVCARVGPGHEPPRDASGAVLGGRVLHMGRDTSWGCALRSHFFLGQDLPGIGLGAADVTAAIPDELGQALLTHCYNELTFLSRFLPSLYVAENRAIPVALPW